MSCKARAQSSLASMFDAQRPFSSTHVAGCHSGTVSAETGRCSVLGRSEPVDGWEPALRAAVGRLYLLVELLLAQACVPIDC